MLLPFIAGYSAGLVSIVILTPLTRLQVCKFFIHLNTYNIKFVFGFLASITSLHCGHDTAASRRTP